MRIAIRHLLFVDVLVGSAGPAVVTSEPEPGPLSGTVLGRMAHPSAGGANDVVGHVGTVLALPRLVVVRPAVGTTRTCDKMLFS